VPSASGDWKVNVVAAHGNISSKRLHDAAENLGFLTDEAFTRANATVNAWLGIRDDYFGLFPRKLDDPSHHIWNYKDCAADLYCHLVLASSLIAPDNLPVLHDVLARERAFATGLPETVDLKTGLPVGDMLYRKIFGAVEYCKDGLLPILERIGETDWLSRLHEVMGSIIEASPYETRFGRLPSVGTEKNGEFLQVLARLYQRERRPEYLAAGRAVADAYVLEVLPGSGGVPVAEWDFERHRPRTSEQMQADRGLVRSGRRPLSNRLKLLDHGNEIFSGLCEWLIAETVAPDSRRERYAPVVERMMDELLLLGRYPDGMWATLLPEDGRPPQRNDGPPNDNWGYLSSAYVGYAMHLPTDDPRRNVYREEAARTMAAAIQHKGVLWTSGADGYADSLEGAQYLLPFINVEGASRWLDDEVGRLLAHQMPDGFVEGTYLDGNYVRTAMLYGLYRTQGTLVRPWRAGLKLGAVKAGRTLYLAVSSDAPWSGRLVFDLERHRTNIGLAFEYPRLNGWPEWFVADPDAQYRVHVAAKGETPTNSVVKGTQLIEGLKLDLLGKTLHLTVEPLSERRANDGLDKRYEG